MIAAARVCRLQLCAALCCTVVVESVDEHGKRIKEKEAALDKWKSVEREQLDAINEEAKQMEKLANKRSLLLKKVCVHTCEEAC